MTSPAPPPPAVSNRTTLIALALLAASLGIRLALTLLNRDANDLHMTVVGLILQTGGLPDALACGECFHPKLFHLVIALLIKVLGIQDALAQIFAAQFVNFTAAALTLVIIWRFLSRFPVGTGPLKLLAFALLAFNPSLIGISAQATNDAFVILFATLALYGAWLFFQRQRPRTFALVLLATILAISSKTNGWVTFVAILVALLLWVLFDAESRRRSAGYALVWSLLVPVLVALNPINQYVHNWRTFRKPLMLNATRPPLPHFFEPTVAARPGMLSIQDGLLTFKLGALLAHPRIDTYPPSYPGHRTSFWTQLYGRAHSVNFDNWPSTWRTTGGQLFPLLRASYLFALLPTALLLLGGVMLGLTLVKSLWRRDVAALRTLQWGLLPLTFWGYLAFVALLSLLYRDFGMMKTIYLYPGVLAFPLAFLTAAVRLPLRWLGAVTVVAAVLVCLYVVDVGSLIGRLMTPPLFLDP